MDLLNPLSRIAILFVLGLILVALTVTVLRGEEMSSEQQIGDAHVLEPDPEGRGLMPGTALSQDNQIQQRISKAIEGNPLVDATEVQVSVQGGIATLTGTVDSPQEANAVEKNAFEAGATGVVNKLRLK